MKRGALVAAALVLGAGVGIAWMDTRPHWDDTGVTAAAIVVVAALGALASVPAWLAAVLVSAPLLVAELPAGTGVLLAVPLAFVGACAGALVRRSVASAA